MHPPLARTVRKLVPASLIALALLGCRPKIPAIAAPERVAASPSPPATMSLCWIESGRFGPATASALLIRHGAETVLVDAGNSSNFDAEIEVYDAPIRRRFARLPGLLKPDRPFSEQLRAIGVEPETITWFIPTHAHIDHIGGYLDLPPLPVLMAAPEQDLIERGRDQVLEEVVPAHARAIAAQIQPIAFDDGPYETFLTHADLFGDGSLILLPLHGHTPGSVGVLVNLPDGRRIFLIGDAANDRKGVAKLRARPKLLRWTDADRPKAEGVVAQLHALVEAAPEIELVPAHERKAYVETFGAPAERCPP